MSAQGYWVLMRHGGRQADDWRERNAWAPNEAGEKLARAAYSKAQEAMRQGGVRLVNPHGVIVLDSWTPRLRSRW